jgi:hypothetical protein
MPQSTARGGGPRVRVSGFWAIETKRGRIEGFLAIYTASGVRWRSTMPAATAGCVPPQRPGELGCEQRMRRR